MNRHKVRCGSPLLCIFTAIKLKAKTEQARMSQSNVAKTEQAQMSRGDAGETEQPQMSQSNMGEAEQA